MTSLNPIEPGKLEEMEKAENPLFCNKIPYPIAMWGVMGLFVVTTIYTLIVKRWVTLIFLIAKIACLLVAMLFCKENVCIRCATWILMLVIVCIDGIVLLFWFLGAKLVAKAGCTLSKNFRDGESKDDCITKKMTIFMIWWVIGVLLYFIAHIFAIVGVYKWWAHGKACEAKLVAQAIGGAMGGQQMAK